MDNNNIIPSDISDTCCANFLKDAALDITKQRPCANVGTFVVKGSLEYGRLFTMTGRGNEIITVCGTHYNLLDRNKKINIHFFRHLIQS